MKSESAEATSTSFSNPSYLAGVVFSMLAAFGFAFKAIFVKLAYNAADVDAVTLLTLRLTLSLPFILVIAFPVIKKGPALRGQDVSLIIVLGVIGYYASSLLDFYGLEYISAGLERLVLYTYPTFTILIGVLFLGKIFSSNMLFSVMVSYAGILIAFTHDLSITEDRYSIVIGCLLVLGCAVLYAVYNAGAEVAIARTGSLKFATLTILVAIIAADIHFVSTRSLDALNLPVQVYAYSLGMALFSTVLPVFWQSMAIKIIGSGKAVMIGLLGPMLTIVFSYWLLGEPVSLAQMVSTLLVMSGVFLIIRCK